MKHTTRFKPFLVATLLGYSSLSLSEQIGEVSTTFNLLTPNDKVVVEVFDDPIVNGVSCYLSHAKTGGIASTVGLATNTSDASVACRQIGKISFSSNVPIQSEVFTVKSSPLFKHLRVMRMVDKPRNTLVYLVYSDKIIDGSPKNSVTAVAVPSEQKIPSN